MQKLFVLLAASVFMVSCSKESVRGSGSTITETRTVSAFSGVRLEGGGKATMVRGSQQKVEVKGYENLVPIYETFVSNGVLVLKFKNDYTIRNSNMEVSITVGDLSYASINGSGEMAISNFDGNSIEAEINGSGDIFTTNNRYITSRLIINGSGYIRGREITANRATARISGSGKIDLTCTDKIEATIQGSGNINYWGNPTEAVSEVSGSGSIKKMQ